MCAAAFSVDAAATAAAADAAAADPPASRVRSKDTPVVETGSIAHDEANVEKAAAKALETYRGLFNAKRAEQVGTAETIFAYSAHSKRFKMTRLLVDEIFKVVMPARALLMERDLSAMPAVPLQDKAALDSLLKVWENTALLGDLALRLPDIVHSLLDRDGHRMEAAEWCVAHCLEAEIYDEVHREQLRLVQQELGFAPRIDPDYRNPYSDAEIRAQLAAAREKKREENRALDALLRRKQRGPKLRRFDL